jgi:hypothetical protein
MNWFQLFKSIITVYSENYKKPINTLCEQNPELNVTAGGTYRYHCALNGELTNFHEIVMNVMPLNLLPYQISELYYVELVLHTL